ncbi:helix-turn-helix transcriptional regulator [Alteromonas sp. C1M14]|uniref:helix-turn-helix domain-containing protein n=1 Tax=Alteromonas sp. C1M14 TaxID=2841567 RepID=UPI001C09FB50|nr:helix-turn-helix transcriptional regulator [Alteromonas sp. C1M14]MBU2977891.1 helix-turn-helix domain-containing protein [Alteromonas sp. C1M14]
MIKHINDPRYEAVIRWLVNARQQKGLTVRQLAALIDESHQFVNKVETCQRRLNVFEYVQYCEALGLTPGDGLNLLKTKKG